MSKTSSSTCFELEEGQLSRFAGAFDSRFLDESSTQNLELQEQQVLQQPPAEARWNATPGLHQNSMFWFIFFLFFWVADSGELYAPQSGLFVVRFGKGVISWHSMGEAFLSAQLIARAARFKYQWPGDVTPPLSGLSPTSDCEVSQHALGWACGMAFYGSRKRP
jgi:hypothetical protein